MDSPSCLPERSLHSMTIAAPKAPAIAPGKKPATIALGGNCSHVAAVCVVLTEAPEVAAALVAVGDESLMDIVVGVDVAIVRPDIVVAVVEAVPKELEVEAEEFARDEVDSSRTHVLLFAHV
jgi:hypothetical protein